MGLFKNEVGRPSNETKKKRKIFYAVVILLVVGIVAAGTFVLHNKFNKQGISSEGKAAGLLNFNVIKTGTDCYTISAPISIKNWKVKLQEKGSLDNKFQDTYEYRGEHYNDGVRKHKVCFDRGADKDQKITYRILIKATTGANDTVYTKIKPNIWKPIGFKYDSSTGWAYKDYTIDFSNLKILVNNSENWPNKKVAIGEYTDKITLVNKTSKKYYYSIYSYVYDKVKGYYEEKRTACVPYIYTKTVTYKSVISKNIESRDVLIYVFNSEAACKAGVNMETARGVSAYSGYGYYR